MKIPFVDLKVQYETIRPEIDKAIEDIFTNSSFVGGPLITEFENAFATYMQAANCIACGNGTDALEIALKALEVGEGDEVIVPAMSWISTSEVVSGVGARPVFADVLPEKYTIDPDDVERRITSKTKAVIPVHLHGRAAEMDQIVALAKKHQLKVLEDAAQAHGTEFKGRRVGTFGDIAAFSFYPGKNLGAYGDAGGIVTNDVRLAETCKLISDHGQVSKHEHVREGRNSRMDTLQAAVLHVKLRYLEQWTEARIARARYYNQHLVDLPVKTPMIESESRHVFHVYGIQVENRDEIQQKMAEQGITCQIHYPKSLPELIPYRDVFSADDYPVAQALGKRGLSLPMYAEITQEQQDYVIEALKVALI